MNAPTREQRLDYLGVTPSETWSKGYETGYQAGRASNDQWRIAVDEALMASALDCTTPDSDPKDCINKLLAWNQEVALDPQVSSEAQTLIDRGRASLLEELRAGGVELPDALQIEQGIGYRLPQSALGLLIAMIQDYGDRRAAAMQKWIAVSERMPKDGERVFAFYKNEQGNGRRIIAQWLPAKFEEASGNDDAEYDYDEATDTYYLWEGWYECVYNWDDYSYVKVYEGEITHWMPLPKSPTETKP